MTTKALAPCVMVLGCTSGAGKSWLAAALCRFYARQGLKVAPFKAQNMSNNARVVAGGEIGSAQYFQALAAGAEPDVRMNPLLLKPEADTRSQVVLLGQVDQALGAMAWHDRKQHVWPPIAAALHDLRASHDLVVIEGAGSPAEINLMATDVVNLRVAREADAACLLLADIDRGGAFAHLYGTWALLPEEDRARIRGFVLNKFRGDAALLEPAPQMLQELTGVPVFGTLPMWRDHGLPEEDGVFDDSSRGHADDSAVRIAIIAYPRLSNLDEFEPLRQLPGVHLRWVRDAAVLADWRAQDWIILPGSKHTMADLQWLREQKLDAAICSHAARGGCVLGICGGLQMLGEAVIDMEGVEGLQPVGSGSAPGLGLLPLVTVFESQKTVRRSQGRFVDAVPGAWQPLSGLPAQGYEIHMGRTAEHPAMVRAGHVALPVLHDADGAAIGWTNGAATALTPQPGQVLGLYLHGLLEQPEVTQALLGSAPPSINQVLDRMADFVDLHLGRAALLALAGVDCGPDGQLHGAAGVAVSDTMTPYTESPVFVLDCDGLDDEKAFWQRYLQLTQAADAEEFGRNLDAFWDALSAQGPGYPGPCTLRVVNTEAIKHWRAGGFLMALEDMAEELPAGHEVQLELVAAE